VVQQFIQGKIGPEDIAALRDDNTAFSDQFKPRDL